MKKHFYCFHQYKNYLCSLLLIVLITSCNLENFELDNFAGPVNLEPTIQLPVATGNYTVWDLITSGDFDSETIYTDDEGLIHFVVNEDDIYEMNTSELIDFPSSIVLDPIHSAIPINSQIGLVNSNDTRLSSIRAISDHNISINSTQIVEIDSDVTVYDLEFKSGTLDVEISYTGITISKGATLVEISNLFDNNGNIAIFSLPINQSTAQIDISGYHLKLSGDDYNEMSSSYEIQIIEGSINPSDDAVLTVKTSFNSLAFETISGDFDFQEVAIVGDNTKFSLDLDFLQELDGTFSFQSPSIIIDYSNGFSLPISLEAEVGGYFKDNTSILLNVTEQQISYPSASDLQSGSSSVQDYVTIDRSNSNIIEFLKVIPDDYITMAGKIVVNKSGSVSPEKPNVIRYDSKANLDVAIDIPLKLKTDGLVMIDTLDVGDIDTDIFQELRLDVAYKNGMQVNLELYVLFVDTISGSPINDMEMLLLGKMKNATVDSEGVTEECALGTLSLDLSEDNIQNLSESNGIVLHSTIGSLENDFSSISASDSLSISLSVLAKIDGSEF